MAAVQAIYQMDIAGTDVADVIREFTTERFAEAGEEGTATDADPTFFAEIVRGVVRRQRDIDPMIDQQLAIGWRLKRVETTLRAILRAGVLELVERHDVPARVVINEYIDLAHAFFDEDEPKVVNGVLDRLAKRLRSAEFPQAGPKDADEPPADEPAVGDVAAVPPLPSRSEEPDA